MRSGGPGEMSCARRVVGLIRLAHIELEGGVWSFRNDADARPIWNYFVCSTTIKRVTGKASYQERNYQSFGRRLLSRVHEQFVVASSVSAVP